MSKTSIVSKDEIELSMYRSFGQFFSLSLFISGKKSISWKFSESDEKMEHFYKVQPSKATKT